jgi:hypothetical protein
MKRETIARLNAHFAEAPEVLRGSPASDDAIAEAQQQLNCRFEPDYIEFLRLFGCGVVGPYPIYGLGAAPDAMGDDDRVVEQTTNFRQQQWPGIAGWYIVSTDGRGNPIGLGPDGLVRLSDHDVGDVPVLAQSFDEFLLNCLRRE